MEIAGHISQAGKSNIEHDCAIMILLMLLYGGYSLWVR